jgi:hypothetical protein
MCSDTVNGRPRLAALEREITELASQIHAATCRWLGLVAEYDAREGWAQWGCRSCAHWVSWRCGVAPGPAREHVRVARRLRELPLVRAAFGRGELSYSKVRALTRVEGVEREQELLELARHATAGQLERLVRAYRGAVAVELRASEGAVERWVSYDYDDDGSLLLRARLPAEEGALVIAALDAARDDASAAPVPPPPAPPTSSPDVPAETPGPSSPARPGSDVPAETPGPSSPARPGSDVPAETPRSSSPAPPGSDVPAETPPVSAGEARADALLLMAETLLAAGPASRTGGDRYQVVLHVDQPTLAGGGRGERCETADGAPLAAETARRLACDAALVPIAQRDGHPLDIGRKTRTIPPALRRALATRDRGCRFPGCTARHFIDAHHIRHWARGGPTKLANLVQLCRHHHRLLHEGGYTLTRTRGGELTFHRPDGRRIPTCPNAPRSRPDAIRRRTRNVAAEACTSLSAGERLDLDLGVAAMLAFAPLKLAEPPGV